MEVVKMMVFANNKFSMIVTNQVRINPIILEILEKILSPVVRKNWYPRMLPNSHMQFLCFKLLSNDKSYQTHENLE